MGDVVQLAAVEPDDVDEYDDDEQRVAADQAFIAATWPTEWRTVTEARKSRNTIILGLNRKGWAQRRIADAVECSYQTVNRVLSQSVTNGEEVHKDPRGGDRTRTTPLPASPRTPPSPRPAPAETPDRPAVRRSTPPRGPADDAPPSPRPRQEEEWKPIMTRVVIANDLPYTSPSTDYKTALRDILAFSARDWAEERDTAAIWAIVFGWGSDDPDEDDDLDEDAWDDVAAKHGWKPSYVAHLKALHEQFKGANNA